MAFCDCVVLSFCPVFVLALGSEWFESDDGGDAASDDSASGVGVKGKQVVQVHSGVFGGPTNMFGKADWPR